MLRGSKQKNLVLQAAKAIRVASKLGSTHAVEIAKAMAHDAEIIKLLGDDMVIGGDSKGKKKFGIKALSSFV